MRGRARVAFHEGLMRAEYLSENEAHLERLFGFLATRKVAAALVFLPVAQDYSAVVNQSRLSEVRATLANLAAKYALGFFDYFTDARLGTADFNDSDHLGQDGVVKFSRILDLEVIRPSLARAQP